MTKVPQDLAGRTPAIIYAAKSTEDKHGSIPTQLADCREGIEREGDRFVPSEHQDEGESAYKGNRGPGLAAAKRAAIAAAEEYGHAELWVQHSDRLARGDGRSADHLAEVFFAMRRAGVRLRSVQDDANLEDAIRAVLIGERNTEDSARKAQAVAAGLRRSAERGKWAGGIPADGYRVLRIVDGRGDITRTVEFDPDRKAIYDRTWSLACKGFSVEAIVAELDRHGYKTRPYKAEHRPRPFDANRVRQTLRNPFYAGLAVHKGEIVGSGDWPAYVTPEDFERLRNERRERGHVDRRRPPGRPKEGYLLARLAVCGECGAPMDCVTGRHVRKDGSRPRRYVCRTHRERPQDCSAKPIDAALIDPSVIVEVPNLLGDIDGIRAEIAAARKAERERMNQEAADAQAEIAECDDVVRKYKARHDRAMAEGEGSKAELLLEMLNDRKDQRRLTERRLDAALDALSAAAEPEEPDVEMSDFYGRLHEQLAGRIEGCREDVKRLNAALIEFLEKVELTREDDGVLVLPLLSEAAAARILRDLDAWPHEVTGQVGGRPVVAAGEDAKGRPVLVVRIPSDADPNAEAERLMNEEGVIEIEGPQAWNPAGQNPPSRW